MTARRIARYRLLRRIGAGGMAEVFRAELEGAEGVTRELVVKRIHGGLASDPEAVSMFVDEARIAARLRHPNVVQVYEFGRDGEDYFLAMELVEGCDLATLIRSWNGSPAPMGVTAWVMGELLEALAHVHGLHDERGEALGLVHCDVSPHNVLVGSAGEVKLADFGIAKAARRRAPGDSKIKGKLAYMAPEQARGEPFDARADLFGAGAILYELLSGQRPYRSGDDVDPVEVSRAGVVVPIRERAPWLSDELVAVVEAAVAPTPEARFSDVRAFAQALDAAFAVDAVRAERSMLASAVRAMRDARADDAAPRADRTLTADEPCPPPAPVVVAPGPPPRPASSKKTRRYIERAAMAVAVFVVALLAERRTRPPPPRPPPPPARPVLLSSRAHALIGAALREAVERRCDVSVRAAGLNAEGAAIETRTWREFALNPGRYAPVEAGEGGAAVTAARPLSLRLAAPDDPPSTTRFALVGIDPIVMFARRVALERLSSLASSPSSISSTLREALGAVPRATRVPSPELDGWSLWDLAAASVALRAEGMSSHKIWVGVGATEVAELLWTARAVVHDPDAASELGASRGVTMLLGWDRALHAMDVLRVGADLTDDDALPPADPNVAFGWAPRSRLREVDPREWRLARPPRGDDWRVDARGEPLGLGAHLVPAEVVGWTLALPAASRAAARCVFAQLTRGDALARVRARAGLCALGSPCDPTGAMDPALRDALTSLRVTPLRERGLSIAARSARWFSLWRDVVLGAPRGTPGDERRLADAWRNRARREFAAAP